MRKSILALLAVVAVMSICSCRHHETYAEQKEKERSAINRYIADSVVNVITEEEFVSNGYVTDLSRNEFVLFESTGVYMQIVRHGCGEKIKDGETATVLCRFTERNLMTDSLQLSNEVLVWGSIVDKMTVKNTSGTFTASFLVNNSLMWLVYGSPKNTAVPAGWLVPLSYINVGRPQKEGDEVAKVRLIVPHSQGHQHATQSVYPCLYDITYERGR